MTLKIQSNQDKDEIVGKMQINIAEFPHFGRSTAHSGRFSSYLQGKGTIERFSWKNFHLIPIKQKYVSFIIDKSNSGRLCLRLKQ